MLAVGLLVALCLIILPVSDADPYVGDTFWEGGLQYEVTSFGPAEVAVAGYDDELMESDLVIPRFVEFEDMEFYVTVIGKWAFSDCHSLESVVIPDSVTSIDDGAFDCCFSLESVVIPDSVTVIGKWAFTRNSLESVVIPDSVTSIDDGAFDASFYHGDNLLTLSELPGFTYIGSGNGILDRILGDPTGIRIASYPYITDYVEGEFLEADDLKVEITFENGDPYAIHGYSISPTDRLDVDADLVIISFAEFTASFPITVTPMPSLKAGDSADVIISVEGQSTIFKFVPEEDGTYFFSSVGGPYAQGRIMDSSWNLLARNDRYCDHELGNFGTEYSLLAGETYYLEAELLYGATGIFNVSLTMVVPDFEPGKTFSSCGLVYKIITSIPFKV